MPTRDTPIVMPDTAVPQSIIDERLNYFRLWDAAALIPDQDIVLTARGNMIQAFGDWCRDNNRQRNIHCQAATDAGPAYHRHEARLPNGTRICILIALPGKAR